MRRLLYTAIVYHFLVVVRNDTQWQALKNFSRKCLTLCKEVVNILKILARIFTPTTQPHAHFVHWHEYFHHLARTINYLVDTKIMKLLLVIGYHAPNNVALNLYTRDLRGPHGPNFLFCTSSVTSLIPFIVQVDYKTECLEDRVTIFNFSFIVTL